MAIPALGEGDGTSGDLTGAAFEVVAGSWSDVVVGDEDVGKLEGSWPAATPAEVAPMIASIAAEVCDVDDGNGTVVKLADS